MADFPRYKIIGPMDSYVWYDPRIDKLCVRVRMERRSDDLTQFYYESVIVEISPEALIATPEGSESVHCSDPDKIRWTRVSEEGIDQKTK